MGLEVGVGQVTRQLLKGNGSITEGEWPRGNVTPLLLKLGEINASAIQARTSSGLEASQFEADIQEAF